MRFDQQRMPEAHKDITSHLFLMSFCTFCIEGWETLMCSLPSEVQKILEENMI